MTAKQSKSLQNLIYSAVFLALAYVLPFLTGQIPSVGKMLLPMHLPALLCGFIFELAAYGAIAGLLHRALPKKVGWDYVSLIVAMLVGRLVWGAVRFACTGLDVSAFGLTAFWTGAFATAWPGIVLQLVVIPPLVALFDRLKRS